MLFMSRLDDNGNATKDNRSWGHTRTVLKLLETQYSIPQLQKETNLPRSTIRGILSKLYHDNLIEKTGNLKNRKYFKI